MTKLAWGGALLWLVVVVCGSGLAWIAIDQAGRGVVSRGPSVTTIPGPTEPTRSADPTRSPTATPTKPSTAPPTKSSSPSTVSRVRTWSGAAGSVTVACAGSVEQLRSATPTDGWRAEREDEGPGVRVKFERGEVEIRVDATCVGGTPSFRVGTDD